MKKIILTMFVLAGLYTGLTFSGVLSSEKQHTPIAQTAKTRTVSKVVVPTKKIESSTSQPLRFVIPKIDVDTHVESVAQDAKGNMDVPKDAENVGWYNLGFKPGEKGNAVLAGHFDDPTGAPAVFYNLDELEPGDELEVFDENNKKYIYTVTRKEKYPVDAFPVPTVFGPSEKSMLNLITCEGTFSKSAATYSHRLVVFSELKEI
jgi:LPXTG-site transpeptidase (sortase) family protein